jgi:L-alanine-DL-glutamate epimerase-like enolase superfamily enzyme
MAVIAAIGTRAIRIPLVRPWGPDVTEVHVVAVDVRDSDGAEGRGFSWTPTIGAGAMLALLDDDIAPAAIGRPAEPTIWQGMWEHLHEAGGGGVTTMALAGLDLALWDLRARRAGVGVPELLGRRHDRQPAYGSGVNLHYSQAELVAQAERWVADGFSAVKIKVGKPDPREDLDRLRAVRAVLGADRALMIHAKQRWDLDRATRALEVLAEVGPAWIEEPLRADDLAGYRDLRSRIGIPVALGENVHTIHRFRDFLDAHAVDIVQPNIIRVGGITPFLAIAELVRERGAELAPHLLPELSAQVAFALPERTWVEDVEDAGFAALGALTRPCGVVIEGGWASGGPALGLGMEFD